MLWFDFSLGTIKYLFFILVYDNKINYVIINVKQNKIPIEIVPRLKLNHYIIIQSHLYKS